MSTATVTLNQHHNRFKDAPWYPSEDTYVLVGGAGGIGSWTSLLLARAGFKPIVYDFDNLEVHNLGGQLYPKSAIGSSKVTALQEIIKNFSDDEIAIFNEKITKDSPTHIYVISAFDNMEARKVTFNSWLAAHGDNPNAMFIDGRLDAEKMTIFCVRGGEKCKPLREEYATQHLFNDDEVEDLPCSFKQTSHAAAMIAAHIVGFFTNHMVNVAEQEAQRDTPFMWDYFIPLNLLEVKNE